MKRTTATSHLSHEQVLMELETLKFSFASIIEKTTEPGTYNRRIAEDACKGVGARIDYMQDSLEANHEKLTAAAVANRLSNDTIKDVGGAIAGASVGVAQLQKAAHLAQQQQDKQRFLEVVQKREDELKRRPGLKP